MKLAPDSHDWRGTASEPHTGTEELQDRGAAGRPVKQGRMGTNLANPTVKLQNRAGTSTTSLK